MMANEWPEYEKESKSTLSQQKYHILPSTSALKINKIN